jgi:hypothetical protein
MNEHGFEALKDLEKMLGHEGMADILEWNTQISDAKAILEEMSMSIGIRELRKLASCVGSIATKKLITTDPSNTGRIAQLQAMATIPDLFEKLITTTKSRYKTALENVEATFDTLDTDNLGD